MYRCPECKAGRHDECEDDTCECTHELSPVDRDRDDDSEVEEDFQRDMGARP